MTTAASPLGSWSLPIFPSKLPKFPGRGQLLPPDLETAAHHFASALTQTRDDAFSVEHRRNHLGASPSARDTSRSQAPREDGVDKVLRLPGRRPVGHLLLLHRPALAPPNMGHLLLL